MSDGADSIGTGTMGGLAPAQPALASEYSRIGNIKNSGAKTVW